MAYFTYYYYEHEFGDKGRYESLESAILAATNETIESTNKSGRELYVSYVQEKPLRWSTTAVDIVEEIEENLCEDSGSDLVYDLVTKEDVRILDLMLKECIEKWISLRDIGRQQCLVSWTRGYRFNESTMQYEFIEEL